MIVMIREDKFNPCTEGRKVCQYIVDTNDIKNKDIKLWIDSLLVDIIANGNLYNDEEDVHPMYELLDNVNWYEIDQSDTIESPFTVSRVVTITK